MVLSKQEGSTPLPRDAKGKRMHEDTELAGVQGTAGISRRDMLRKSAVVGGAGALMWAAPSITKFGSAAFGDEHRTGTPLGGYSNAGALIVCPLTGYDFGKSFDDPDNEGDYELFRAKVEFDDKADPPDWDWEVAAGALGGCETHLDAWGDAADVNAAKRAELGLVWTDPPGTVDVNGVTYNVFEMKITGATDCFFANEHYEGVVSSLKEGTCCIKADRINDRTLRWYGPFPNGQKDPCSDANILGQEAL